MSTVRQDIVDALVNRLKVVGYRVFSHYPENLQVEILPMIVIKDVSDSLTPLGRDQIEHNLRVEIMGFVSNGTTTDESCRALIGTIADEVMDPEDRTMGGVCDSMELLDGGSIQIEQQTDKTVGSVSLALSATYRTDRGNWSDKL